MIEQCPYCGKTYKNLAAHKCKKAPPSDYAEFFNDLKSIPTGYFNEYMLWKIYKALSGDSDG